MDAHTRAAPRRGGPRHGRSVRAASLWAEVAVIATLIFTDRRWAWRFGALWLGGLLLLSVLLTLVTAGLLLRSTCLC